MVKFFILFIIFYLKNENNSIVESETMPVP